VKAIGAFVVLLCLLVLLSVREGFTPWRRGGSSVEVRKPAVETLPNEARPLAIHEVWLRNTHNVTINELGHGKGIVFSPDLSDPGNRSFFSALGFGYFEDPDWRVVILQVKAYNQAHPDYPIRTLLIESHGTWGDALKLQNGKEPGALRSYISLAALQEHLAGSGVRVCLLAACNAGRLFRPDTYQNITQDQTNPLFEPPTLGIIDVSPEFDASQSEIVIGRRSDSHLEVIDECHVSELSKDARATLAAQSGVTLNPAAKIAVPEMLIELMLEDGRLHLITGRYETEKSRTETNDGVRERLISRFFGLLNQHAARSRS